MQNAPWVQNNQGKQSKPGVQSTKRRHPWAAEQSGGSGDNKSRGAAGGDPGQPKQPQHGTPPGPTRPAQCCITRTGLGRRPAATGGTAGPGGVGEEPHPCVCTRVCKPRGHDGSSPRPQSDLHIKQVGLPQGVEAGPLKRPQASQGLGWYCPRSDAHIALGSHLSLPSRSGAGGTLLSGCPWPRGLTPCRAW